MPVRLLLYLGDRWTHKCEHLLDELDIDLIR